MASFCSLDASEGIGIPSHRRSVRRVRGSAKGRRTAAGSDPAGSWPSKTQWNRGRSAYSWARPVLQDHLRKPNPLFGHRARSFACWWKRVRSKVEWCNRAIARDSSRSPKYAVCERRFDDPDVCTFAGATYVPLTALDATDIRSSAVNASIGPEGKSQGSRATFRWNPCSDK